MFSFANGNFIFRFLPAVLLLYYCMPVRYRRILLLAASFLFYAAADLRFVGLLFAATVVNYLLARPGAGKRGYLTSSVLLDVALLATCKALGYFYDPSYLPLGISFYTFKMISFQADRYRGKITALSFVDTVTYFALFPQVLMGPIMRYEDYASCDALTASALSSRRENASRYLTHIEEGLFYFIAGLSLKVLLADHLASLWNAIGTIGYDALSTPLAWLGALTYSMNLYYDFWGYSLMAAGIGVMLGFPFIENFRHPYAAKGVADFYRRWHMTLGSWFRDYVYIPLGGSRGGSSKTLRNLLVVWLLTGIWHGSGWNFLLWGGLLFLLIAYEKFLLSKSETLFSFFSRLHVWILIPLTWVVFAISDLHQLRSYFLSLFPFYGVSDAAYEADFMKYATMYAPYLIAGLLLLFPQVFSFLEKHRRNPVLSFVMAALFLITLYSLANAAGNPFMYMRF